MSWVTERAEQIKQREHTRASDREWQIHSDKIIREKAPALWNALAFSIERDVREFNEAIGNNPQRKIEFQTTVPNGLIGRKPYFPALCLTAGLEVERHAILFAILSTRDHDSPTHKTTGILRIRLFDDGKSAY